MRSGRHCRHPEQRTARVDRDLFFAPAAALPCRALDGTATSGWPAASLTFSRHGAACGALLPSKKWQASIRAPAPHLRLRAETLHGSRIQIVFEADRVRPLTLSPAASPYEWST